MALATFNLNTPNIPDEADILTQVRQIRSYITNLNNQLRYDLSNIDEDNLTGGELPENAISRGFRQKVHDLQGNMSVFEQTATHILARVENAEGDISTLEQTATSFGTRISNAEGDISTLEQTANSLISRVSGVEGVNSTQQTEINQNKLDITLKASETTVTALAGRVTTAESSISTQAGQIALKAEKTVTDGLNTRLTSAEEKITPNAITATVRSHANYQSDLSAKNRTFVGGTPTGMIAGDLWIDSANGNLLKRYDGSAWAAVQDGAISIAQQQADKIQWLVASGTSAANMTLTSQLYSLMAANIDLSANNSIKLAVSNIDIGGANLLPNSDFTGGLSDWSTSNLDISLQDAATYDGKNTLYCIKATGVASGSVYRLVSVTGVVGDTYTLSLMVYGSATLYGRYGTGTILEIRTYPAGGGTPIQFQQLKADKIEHVYGWQKISTTIELTSACGMIGAIVYVRAATDQSNSIFVTNLMLERGNKPSAWQRSMRDPASGVKTSKVTIDGTGIAMTTGGTFTTTSQNFNIDAAGNVVMKGTVEAAAGKIGELNLSGGILDNNNALPYKRLILNPVDGTMQVGLLSFDTNSTGWGRLSCPASTNFTISSDNTTPGTPLRLVGGRNSEIIVGGYSYASKIVQILDDLYVQNNCSALSFTDRTPAYSGNALDELRWVQGKKGQLDHDSIPPFARKQIATRRDKPDGSYEEVMEEGRDLGAMVSVLTRAVQQLADKVDSQQRLIEDLNRRVSA